MNFPGSRASRGQGHESRHCLDQGIGNISFDAIYVMEELKFKIGVVKSILSLLH